MYCTNLNYKPLNELEVSALKESKEIIGSEWNVYNLQQCNELKVLYKFKFDETDVLKLNSDGVEVDRYNW